MSLAVSDLWTWLRREAPRVDAGRNMARLRLVRRLRVLEHVRALFALLQDGKEKRAGDYIYDRAYITSLVDQALERSEMLLFDVSVLSPSEEPRLRAAQRAIVHKAREAFLDPDALRRMTSTGAEAAADEDPSSPEDRLLTEVLHWLEDPPPEADHTMRVLVRLALEAAFRADDAVTTPRRPDPTMHVECGGAVHSLAAIDLDAGGPAADTRDPHEPACRPLGALLRGARASEETSASAPPLAIRRWSAVLEEFRLELRGHTDQGSLWLLGSLCGRSDSDFVYLHAPAPLGLPTWVPETFHLEPLEGGHCAWIYGMASEALERHLEALGRALFGNFAMERQ